VGNENPRGQSVHTCKISCPGATAFWKTITPVEAIPGIAALANGSQNQLPRLPLPSLACQIFSAHMHEPTLSIDHGVHNFVESVKFEDGSIILEDS
jgi:hypothetical protein